MYKIWKMYKTHRDAGGIMCVKTCVEKYSALSNVVCS